MLLNRSIDDGETQPPLELGVHSLFLLVLAVLCTGVASAGETTAHATPIAGHHQSALLHEEFARPDALRRNNDIARMEAVTK
jgi:hypothetical protein